MKKKCFYWLVIERIVMEICEKKVKSEWIDNIAWKFIENPKIEQQKWLNWGERSECPNQLKEKLKDFISTYSNLNYKYLSFFIPNYGFY